MGQAKSSADHHTIARATNKSTTSAQQKETSSLSTDLFRYKLVKRCEHINFDVEAWYGILQSETFYTEFVSLSPALAEAFVHYYRTRYNSKPLLTVADLRLIESMQDQLKQKIFNPNKNRFQANGSFIRLSSRSPKDGTPLDAQALIRSYQKELNMLQAKHPEECDTAEGRANMQLIAYSNAQFQCLRVTNELEALNLILSSERVFIDLLEALDCQQVADHTEMNSAGIQLHDWNNNIIVRQWDSLLDSSMEFRCFVYQSDLTAISQYNHYCKFYQLQDVDVIQRIKTTIVKYWHRKIQPLMAPYKEKYANYIIDIGLIQDSSSDEVRCTVIELNPFAIRTGASLFDWKRDVNQLTGQSNSIEIRVRSSYLSDVTEYMEYVTEENKLNIGDDSSRKNDPSNEPYFEFLRKIRKQLH
jgi:D123